MEGWESLDGVRLAVMGGMLTSLGVRSFRTALSFRPGVRTNFLSGPVWLRGRGILVPEDLALSGVASLWSARCGGGNLREFGTEGQSSERESSHAWDDISVGGRCAVRSRTLAFGCGLTQGENAVTLYP